MIYIVCVAYISAVLIFSRCCAYWYRCALLNGYLPDKHALINAVLKAFSSAKPLSQHFNKDLTQYQRYVLLIGYALAIVVLSLYLYLYTTVLIQKSYYFLLLWHLWVLAVLILLASIDLKTRLLPDALCIPLLFSGFIVEWLFPQQIDLNSWLTVLAVAVLVYGIYAFTYYCVGEAVLGLGDVKLYIALSACLPSIKATVQLYLFACLGCWFVQALWQRRCLPQGNCAFGPYLVLGYILANVSLPALQ